MKFCRSDIVLLALYLASITTSANARSLITKRNGWRVGQAVRTSSGTVLGCAASNVTEVSTYLGIPYARPPIGNLRFAHPQKYESKNKLDATKFGHSCPSGSNFGGGTAVNTTGKNLTAAGYIVLDALIQTTGPAFSEDCLTVNVWTKPQSGERKKAVLVWLYGGGFTSGTSADPMYNGEHIVDQEDVIFVSFNYRMNIFGFPGNPVAADNLGLLDQRLAIEWVRDNIHAFGGDPSRITLFGQSAGSASIDFYSYAWVDDPIVAGLVMESGTTGLGVYSKNDTAASWYNVTLTLGCGDASSNPDSVLACMRTKNTTEISAAIPLSDSAFGAAAFWPTADETVVFSDYPARSAAGKFIKVPLLIGNNNYEAGFFKTIASVYNDFLPETTWDILDNFSFSCPAANRANISSSAGLPTWRYRYFGEFPDLQLTTFPDSGAWHGSEVSVLFNTLQEGNRLPSPTKAELAIGNNLRAAWAAFAKDPKKGLECFGGGWPKYNAEEKTLIRLAYNNTVGINVADPSLYDSVCG